MIRNALSNALCRELGMEWRRRGEVVVIGEAYGIMKSTADAMDALREHSHGSQIISEQKWKSCLAPIRGKILLVQKRSSGAMWTFSSGLRCSRAA